MDKGRRNRIILIVGLALLIVVLLWTTFYTDRLVPSLPTATLVSTATNP